MNLKYVYTFCLGLIFGIIVAFFIPESSIKKALDLVHYTEKENQELIKKNNSLTAKNDSLTTQRDNSLSSINKLQQEKDSLLHVIEQTDDTLIKITKNENETINSIHNANDKQLYDFFSNYRTR